ncbi:MAG TPA: methionyl-tRNA formyltransferase, partial [Salinimicrobium sp.]|nr:methionyl-tRNA formyltransferase [Salinimicrobium sp.]
RMLPEQVWKIPEYGTFNLHASLLPQYRGAAPINWAVINGEKITGVTTFFIDQKIDTGKLILQKELPIDECENAGDVHDKLMTAGAELVLNTLEQIREGNLTPIPQPEDQGLKQAPKLTKENTRIDWKNSIFEIFDFIRGLSPFPTAWTILENGNDILNIKIYASEKEIISHEFETGKLIQEGKQLKIAVSEGFIFLKEIQLPGKKKMKIKEFLNGYKIFSNAKVV